MKTDKRLNTGGGQRGGDDSDLEKLEKEAAAVGCDMAAIKKLGDAALYMEAPFVEKAEEIKKQVKELEKMAAPIQKKIDRLIKVRAILVAKFKECKKKTGKFR